MDWSISSIFCGRKNMAKLKKLQELVLHLVCCDKKATYDDLLERGNSPLSQIYCIECLALEVYKVFKSIHGFNLTYLNGLFIEPMVNYTFRHKCRLNQPKFHMYMYGLRSVKYFDSKFRNSLMNACDINTFLKKCGMLYPIILVKWLFYYIHISLNSLRAKLCRGNINIYLHFMSFLHTYKTQVVEIPPRVRQGLAYFT